MTNNVTPNPVATQIADWLQKANKAQRTSEFPTAIAATQRAIALAQAEKLLEPEVRGHYEWARTLLLQGDFLAAYTKLEDTLSQARAIGLRHIEANALRALGLTCSYQSLFAEAERHLLQALHIYRDTGNRQGEGRTCNTLGENYSAQMQWQQAQSYMEQALSICREIGDRTGERWTLGNLGEICRMQGDYVGARTYYKSSLDAGHTLGDKRSDGINLSNLSLVAHMLEDDQTAWDYAQQAVALGEAIGDKRLLGFALDALGHALIGLNRWDEARSAYQQSLNIKNEIGELNQAMEPLAGLAHVALLHQNNSRALRYAEEILAHLAFEGALNGVDDPCRVYLICYQVLHANTDPRAPEILERSIQQLQTQATRIADAAKQRAYLEDVPCHREIMALSQQPQSS